MYTLSPNQMTQLAQGSGRTLDSVLAHYGLTPSQGASTSEAPGAPPTHGGPGPRPRPPKGPRPGGGPTTSTPPILAPTSPPGAPAPQQPPAKVPTSGGPMSGTNPGGAPAPKAPSKGPRAGSLPGTGGQPVPTAPQGTHIAPGTPLAPNQVRRGDRVFTRGVSGKGNPILGRGPDMSTPAAGPSQEAIARFIAQGGQLPPGMTSAPIPGGLPIPFPAMPGTGISTPGTTTANPAGLTAGGNKPMPPGIGGASAIQLPFPFPGLPTVSDPYFPTPTR